MTGRGAINVPLAPPIVKFFHSAMSNCMNLHFLFYILFQTEKYCASLCGSLGASMRTRHRITAMNLQQLRIVRETVRRNFNLTQVANSLFTSQSGVSKNIKDLEDELGIELFVRRGKRLLGLTDPGKEMVEIVERVLADTASIKRLGEQFNNREQGKLVIATTHTQARYVLPHVVAAFRLAYPKVHLTLHQASPAEIDSMLSVGAADIGICTEMLRNA